jgi:hypothetical protein
VLFDPRVHEPLYEGAWRATDVEAEIRTIAREAEDALTAGAWWPVHPLDVEEGDPAVWHGLYMGAAGVVWALDHLARAGLHEPRLDHAALAGRVLESYLSRPEFDDARASLWNGEAGIALLAWRLAPTPALADRLAEVAVVPANDTLELMWGSPGLLILADVMLTRTAEQRWASAWRALADHLMLRCGEEVPGYWTQRLYGWRGEYVGPAHGMAGIVAALARRPEFVPLDVLASETTQAATAGAVREGSHANWRPALQDDLVHRSGSIRTQWCHGAPGVVASLAALPREDELDALLTAGGELTWTAGPLRKGANLCHGTSGNGFAFLKLFTRTGDEIWLERARRFALHAGAQVTAARRQYGRGRYSLWTGDLGTAVYLHQCLAGTSEMPTIDTL